MTFSASRISTWMACNRKAAWTYIAGYPEEGTDATDFGGQVHAYLENLKKTPGSLPDRMSDVGAVAAEALPFVEDFSVADGAEVEAEFTLRGRHAWRGFKDLRSLGRVTDYKTTGDFKWAKTPADLFFDPQAVLYAEDEYRRGATSVELQWLYLKKRPPYSAKPVRVTMPRDWAALGFEALEQYADEMQAVAFQAPSDPVGRHKFVLDVVQPNTDFCHAYNKPCPHQARCGISFFHEQQKRGTKPMNLQERLEAIAAGRPVPPPAVVPSAPAFTVHAAGPAATLQPGVHAPAVPAVHVAPTSGTVFTPAFLAQPPTPPADAVEEPDAPPVAEVAPGQVNPPAAKRGRPRKAPAPASVVAAAPAPAPVATMTPAAAMAELKAALQPLVSFGVAPTPPAEPVAPASPAAPAPHRIGTLYVGCLPRGVIGEVPDFDRTVAQAKIAIGPQDWRLHDYGKGNGLLLDMFMAIVQHEKPQTMVVTDPRAPEAILCLSYLRGISGSVVEALR